MSAEQPDQSGRSLSPGDTALVFDGVKWRVTGDVGDNSQFWHPCRIVHVYRKFDNHGEWLAVVRWPDGRVSGGHIVSMMREVAHA